MENNIEKLIISTISEISGADVSDIKSEDFLIDDLHLGPTELTELLEKLSEKGCDTSKLENIQEMTVSDLTEELTLSS